MRVVLDEKRLLSKRINYNARTRKSIMPKWKGKRIYGIVTTESISEEQIQRLPAGLIIRCWHDGGYELQINDENICAKSLAHAIDACSYIVLD